MSNKKKLYAHDVFRDGKLIPAGGGVVGNGVVDGITDISGLQVLNMELVEELPNNANLNNLQAGTAFAASGQTLLNAPPEYNPASKVVIYTTEIDNDNGHQEMRVQREFYDVISSNVQLTRTVRTLGSLPVGSIVRFNVDGILRNFLVIHQGNPGNEYAGFENRTTLLMERIWGNRRANSSNVNDYANSEIHAWLNNEFLNMIDVGIRNDIAQVRIPFRPGSGLSQNVSHGASGLLTSVFLLSLREIGTTPDVPFANLRPNAEGVRFSHFIDGVPAGDQRRIAMHQIGFTGAPWFLRSPWLSQFNPGYFFIVSSSGRPHEDGANAVSASGIRPALTLPSTLSVRPSGTIGEPEIMSIPQNFDISDNILTWSAVSGATGYRVYINSEPLSGIINETSFDLLGLNLDPGTHVLQVRAIGDGAYFLDSELSESITFIVEEPLPIQLNKPVNLELDGSVLRWNSVEDAVGYRIYANGLVVSNIIPSLSGARALVVKYDLSTLALQPGSNEIQVRAIGDGASFDDSPLSDSVMFQVDAPTTDIVRHIKILYRAKIDGVWRPWEFTSANGTEILQEQIDELKQDIFNALSDNALNAIDVDVILGEILT